MSEIKQEAAVDENEDNRSIADSEWTFDTSESRIGPNGLKELKLKMAAMKYKNQALEAKVENQELRAKMRDKSLERVKMANNELNKKMAQIEATLGMEKIDVKMIMLGGSGCGKTSLCKQYMNKTFSETYTVATGGEWNFKTVVQDNRLVNIQIWDTVGQERFASINAQYFRNVHGLILVYDLCDLNSFYNMIIWWEKFMEHQNPAKVGVPNVPMIVVGNKLDKVTKGSGAAVTTTTSVRAKKWCETNCGIHHFEASAKEATNVDAAFDIIRQKATDYRLNMGRGKENDDAKIVSLALQQQKQIQKKSRCCS